LVLRASGRKKGNPRNTRKRETKDEEKKTDPEIVRKGVTSAGGGGEVVTRKSGSIKNGKGEAPKCAEGKEKN